MLWIIIVVLFILWLLGFFGGRAWNNNRPYGGGWIHTLIVIAVILAILTLLHVI